MQAPDPIEAALGRLMPPGLSEDGLGSIHAMLDELAAQSPAARETPAAAAAWSATPETPSARRRVRIPAWLATSGIAAALAFVATMETGPRPDDALMAVLEIDPPPVLAGSPASGLVLVGEFDHIETMTDEGWVTDPDGVAMEATRIRVVGGTTFMDEETGVLVQVSEPREEIFLTPVTAF